MAICDVEFQIEVIYKQVRGLKPVLSIFLDSPIVPFLPKYSYFKRIFTLCFYSTQVTFSMLEIYNEQVKMIVFPEKQISALSPI